MGFTLDPRGKPIANDDATNPGPMGDLQAAYDWADKVGAGLRGTSVARLALTSAESDIGQFFVETDTGDVYKRTPSGWDLVWTQALLAPWNSNVPVPRTALMKTGQAAGVTGPTGVLSHDFPTAFPGGCSAVVLMPHQNSGHVDGGLPLVVEASVTARGFQTIWGNRASSPVRVNYLAVGY